MGRSSRERRVDRFQGMRPGEWKAPRARQAALVMLVATLGCLEPTSPSVDAGAGALTVTDSSVYAVPAAGGEPIRIRLTFSNRTTDTVYIIRCGGPWPEIEKLVGPEWVRASKVGQPLCLQATPVRRGAQLRVDYVLYPDLLSVDELPGTYRVVWDEVVWNFERRTATSLFGDLLPLANRVSNDFRIGDL